MKLAVFGASGPTGREIVRQALERGDEVTAFVRAAPRLGVAGERLRVVVGDTTTDTARVVEAVRGRDAVASALGRRASFRSDGLIARSMAAIVPAMERCGVRRLVLLSACGVGESRRMAPCLPRLMYRLLLRDIFADKRAAEDAVRASALDWTFVYPTMLTDGPLTGRYRAGERLELRGIMPRISRADVAHFVLRELDRGEFVRKVAVVSD